MQVHLKWSFVILYLLGHGLADADFASVHMRDGDRDMSGRLGDPPGKYWRE